MQHWMNDLLHGGFLEISGRGEGKMKAGDRMERMKISSEMQIRRGDCLSSIVRVSCLQGTANYNLSSYSVGQ